MSKCVEILMGDSFAHVGMAIKWFKVETSVKVLLHILVFQHNNSLFTDINECNEVNDCQQLCTNTEGSYICGCEEGFTLAKDRRNCNGNYYCYSTN